jgi:hypothetical protein
MPTTDEKTILATPEDWEPWIEHLQGEVDNEIWPIIDPNESDDDGRELKKPNKPKFADIQQGATSLASF